MKNCIVEDGRKIRVGPVYKTEISDALGLSQRYVWYYLIHRNENLMKQLVAMGYNKKSHTITRSMARFIAKHFDTYIEGVNEEDKCVTD